MFWVEKNELGDFLKVEIVTGWWQLTCFLFLPLKFGEMIQFDEHVFQMSWFNHQLENLESFEGLRFCKLISSG